MQVYKSKHGLLSGSSYSEVVKIARKEYHSIQKRTPRRQAYVRSKYFTKDKIFINEFWKHLQQKAWPDRVRRVKLFSCAIDLIRNNVSSPEIRQNTANPNEFFYRFVGEAKSGQKFIVQIKGNKRTRRKDFISVFPKGRKK